MLHVLDACARNGILVTANGVTDDHERHRLVRGRANWITRLWARSVELPDLQAALRAGRAFAYKPDGWAGTLDATAAGRPAMGAVAVAGGRPVPVAVTATELPRGGALEVVTGRVDRAARGAGGDHHDRPRRQPLARPARRQLRPGRGPRRRRPDRRRRQPALGHRRAGRVCPPGCC